MAGLQVCKRCRNAQARLANHLGPCIVCQKKKRTSQKKYSKPRRFVEGEHSGVDARQKEKNVSRERLGWSAMMATASLWIWLL